MNRKLIDLLSDLQKSSGDAFDSQNYNEKANVKAGFQNCSDCFLARKRAHHQNSKWGKFEELTFYGRVV